MEAAVKLENKKRLEDFVERAEHIRNFSYFEGGKNIVGFEAKKEAEKWQIDFYQPSNEQRDAIVFNLRLFLQDKDGISFRKLADLCNDPDVSKQWKDEFEFVRKILNLRLDDIVAEGNKGKLTNRDILNMFLFGKLAHNDSNDENNKLYQKWVSDDVEYEILHNTFHTILIWLSTAILNISSASKEELHRHTI